jgi:hypothetical protein
MKLTLDTNCADLETVAKLLAHWAKFADAINRLAEGNLTFREWRIFMTGPILSVRLKLPWCLIARVCDVSVVGSFDELSLESDDRSLRIPRQSVNGIQIDLDGSVSWKSSIKEFTLADPVMKLLIKELTEKK